MVVPAEVAHTTGVRADQEPQDKDIMAAQVLLPVIQTPAGEVAHLPMAQAAIVAEMAVRVLLHQFQEVRSLTQAVVAAVEMVVALRALVQADQVVVAQEALMAIPPQRGLQEPRIQAVVAVVSEQIAVQVGCKQEMAAPALS
jgi:hypothetical protein